MNSANTTYDVIIVGGGLAGLSLAIVLAKKNYKVLLLEKETYPKHKVCGEYISLESWPFLERLGLPLGAMNLPIINQLTVTDTMGNDITTPLPQGGFGISRYRLDAALAELATKAGAQIMTRTKAENIIFKDGIFRVVAGAETYTAKVACGAWGKRSNMDVKWQRSFITGDKKKLSNYVGIKYHINYAWPRDVIGLHNFTDGYCGISQIEDGKCCLCYLTTAAALHRSGNDIKKLEQDVLMKNPVLQKIFTDAEFLYDAPMAISQVSFQRKEHVLEHVLLMGDAAGMITPLCGNGMSMALHASAMSARLIDDFLQQRVSRGGMEQRYTKAWEHTFSTRTTLGRIVQANFGKARTTAFFIKAMKRFPFIRKAIISGTSGKPF